jgi:type I restriction-modification system DNA methylase subunit
VTTSHRPPRLSVSSFDRITERTLYPPISNILNKYGFKNISEIRIGHGVIDIECFYGELKLVVEVKIEDPHTKLKNLLEGVAQGYEYSKSSSSVGFVVIEYPASVRRPLVFKPEVIEDLALSSQVNVMALTDFWTHKCLQITSKDFFSLLKERTEAYVQRQEKSVSLDFAVDTIRDAIISISGILREIVGIGDDLINTVVGRFDYFAAMAEKNEEKLRVAAIDLSSYLLVNQILFYHIYASLTEKVDDLDENNIRSVHDLKNTFKQITDINYKAVYSVDVVSSLPDLDIIVDSVRQIIRAIKGTRAAYVRQDLIGRIYHKTLPSETRKVLAAFYTKPIAAEILAGLCIERSDETVIDPACGSGTLLVATYKRKEENRKRETGKNQLSINEIEELHKAFTEEQITGLDIMPFACHLTAVNLSSQNPRTTTNKLRVAKINSLSLQSQLNLKEFKTKGLTLKTFPRDIQNLIPTTRNKQIFSSRTGTVAEGLASPEGVREKFVLSPVDTVIMNPPFTDRERLPDDDRAELGNYDSLINYCGNGINLWGYFLALANLLLKEGGKIGAVIPVNIARGETTDKIRRFIFQNYHVNYWIKPVGDFAFSESASFKDSLFVATKKEPTENDTTCIVLFKKSLKKMTLANSQDVVERLTRLENKEGTQYEDEYFAARFVKQSKMIAELDNLMLLVGGSNFQNTDKLRAFLKSCLEIGKNKLSNLPESMMKEGITSPKGLGQLVYITKPIHESRTERAFLIMAKTSGNNIITKVKNTKFRIRVPEKVTQPALRTSTGIRRLDIGNNYDRIIKSKFPHFKFVLTLSKWNGKFTWTTINKKIERLGESRLVIPDKIRLSSKNTYVLGIYSDNPLILSNLFYTYRDIDPDRCKILCLSLNSIFTLAQFLGLKSETLGGYIRLSAKDWSLTKQIDYDKIKENEKQELLMLFEELRSVTFPSIIEQIETKFWARTKLDTTILKCLGFNENEISGILSNVYAALVGELKALKTMES